MTETHPPDLGSCLLRTQGHKCTTYRTNLVQVRSSVVRALGLFSLNPNRISLVRYPPPSQERFLTKAGLSPITQMSLSQTCFHHACSSEVRQDPFVTSAHIGCLPTPLFTSTFARLKIRRPSMPSHTMWLISTRLASVCSVCIQIRSIQIRSRFFGYVECLSHIIAIQIWF